MYDLQPEQKLWKLNCITYSVVVAWRDVNSEIKGNPSITQKKDKELTVIEKKIVQTRQLLSKTSAEREAMQKQTKMTKRRVKGRKQISVECKSLSVKDLTEFIDKLKHRLKNLARRNKQQKAKRLQRKWDNSLQSEPRSVYKHLTKSLERKRKEEKPRLSQDEKKFERPVDHEQDQRYFENTDEVDTFWRGLWETESKDNLDVNWINEVEESIGAEVSEEEIAEIVEVTRDWKETQLEWSRKR